MRDVCVSLRDSLSGFNLCTKHGRLHYISGHSVDVINLEASKASARNEKRCEVRVAGRMELEPGSYDVCRGFRVSMTAPGACGGSHCVSIRVLEVYEARLGDFCWGWESSQRVPCGHLWGCQISAVAVDQTTYAGPSVCLGFHAPWQLSSASKHHQGEKPVEAQSLPVAKPPKEHRLACMTSRRLV